MWYVCTWRKNWDSLKYAAVTSIPSNTKLIRTVSSTFFRLDALSFWVFGAVMGFLWRPGLGTTDKNIEMVKIKAKCSINIKYCYKITIKPTDSLPVCLWFNGLTLSSGTWLIVWRHKNKDTWDECRCALHRLREKTPRVCRWRGLYNIGCKFVFICHDLSAFFLFSCGWGNTWYHKLAVFMEKNTQCNSGHQRMRIQVT